MRRNHAIVALATSFAAVLLFSGFPTSARANSAPIVTHVVAMQIPNTGQVRVTFDVSDADGDPVTARLVCASSSGGTFDLLPATVSGDVNRVMAAGPGKQIIWDASHDYPGRHFTQVVAKVIASDGPAMSGEMVPVPAGTFTMGTTNEQSGGATPPHSVYLDDYSIDKYEVTNAEYQTFIDAGGYSTPAFWSGAGWAWRTAVGITAPDLWSTYAPCCPGYPVGGVSFYEAEAYARFAGKRLPTEAEWERAARGTDGRSYPWGEDLDWHRANYHASNDPYETGLTPVGFYDGRIHPNPTFQTLDSPSPVGAYDMCGNVAEWVADWWDYYPAGPVSNPTGPVSGTSRVVRGGTANTSSSYYLGFYYGYASVLQGYYRWTGVMGPGPTPTYLISTAPDSRTIWLGFRCAKSGL